MNLCNGSRDGSSEGPSLMCSRRPISKRRRPKNMTDGDMMKVRDLANLSPEDRTHVYEEIHGVARDTAIPTDPIVIQGLLDMMEKKLGKIRKKKAYDMASFIFPRYTKGRELRLRFLHALQFDPVKAAQRYVHFFSVKLQLFGRSFLGKEIMFGDLSPGTQEAFRAACLQLFPNKIRDRSGRAVFFQKAKLVSVDKTTYWLQSLFYLLMAGMRELSNEELSNGIVVILDSIGMRPMVPSEFAGFAKSLEVVKAIPGRIAACHICFDAPHIQPAASLFQMALSKPSRVRIQTFKASTHTEMLYYLNSFGIGQSIFPLDFDGNTDFEKFEVLLQARIADENRMVRDSSIVPTDVDVIAGRGKSYIAHAGNVAFLKLADGYQTYYATASKEEKAYIVRQIHQSISDQGGRFLKLSHEGLDWELLNTYEACNKIRNAFRWKQVDISRVF